MRLALLAALGVAVALPTWLGAAASAPAPARAAAVAPDSGAHLVELRVELARLAERLERSERAPAVPAEPPSAPAGDELRRELDAVASALDGLRAELSALRADLARGGGAPPLPAPAHGSLRDAAKPAVDWLEWEVLAATWRADPDAARDEVLFLGPRELLARFGPPTRVRADEDGELRWSWWRRAADGALALRAEVSLHGGYVTALSIRDA